MSYSPIRAFVAARKGVSPVEITEPRRIGCEHDATATTRGHLADHGGLRGHSVGDSYPWRVVGYGDDSWAVEGADGATIARFYGDDACKRADTVARINKLLHPAGRIEVGPHGPQNISGDPATIPERLAGQLLVVTRITGSGTKRDHYRVANRNHTPDHLLVLHHGTGKVRKQSIYGLVHRQTLAVTIDETDFAWRNR